MCGKMQISMHATLVVSNGLGRFSTSDNFRAKRHFTFVSELLTATFWKKLLKYKKTNWLCAKNIAGGKPAQRKH